VILYYDLEDISNIKLSNYKRLLKLPNDVFSNSCTNDEIRSYLIKKLIGIIEKISLSY
jgi:hypothetical protein